MKWLFAGVDPCAAGDQAGLGTLRVEEGQPLGGVSRRKGLPCGVPGGGREGGAQEACEAGIYEAFTGASYNILRSRVVATDHGEGD